MHWPESHTAPAPFRSYCGGRWNMAINCNQPLNLSRVTVSSASADNQFSEQT